MTISYRKTALYDLALGCTCSLTPHVFRNAEKTEVFRHFSSFPLFLWLTLMTIYSQGCIKCSRIMDFVFILLFFPVHVVLEHRTQIELT